MRKGYMRILTVLLVTAFLMTLPAEALAYEGTLGYQGGISIENKTKKDEYQYSEMCFLTGKPILLTGTLTVKKTDKNGITTATYTYKLTNPDYNANMNRVVFYQTTKSTKPNGQITEVTTQTRLPTEVVTIGNNSYKLTSSSFTRSMLKDPKPAINYDAGEFTDKKIYTIGGDSSNTVTVNVSGKLYAYEQYWSSTQTQKLNITVDTNMKKASPPIQWGGSAEVIVASTSRQQIQYSKNEPTQISFDGGYVQKRWTE
ncbi:MAG: S-layer homology domain-containing protein, partial [Clostridia bacterium]|nr:S-layer homology domain-containing protein [Clostridia bacterium]